MRAGLSIPFILPTMKRPPTSIAPVLPALRKASACLSLTSFIATTSEESFFDLTAFVGTSSNSITSVAFTTSMPDLSFVFSSMILFISSSFPTRTTVMSGLPFTASSAPTTISYGALSPPIASTAILIVFLPHNKKACSVHLHASKTYFSITSLPL